MTAARLAGGVAVYGGPLGVRVYAAHRKPVASGRGASGLAGRPPVGSSSL